MSQLNLPHDSLTEHANSSSSRRSIDTLSVMSSEQDASKFPCGSHLIAFTSFYATHTQSTLNTLTQTQVANFSYSVTM